MSPDRRVVQFQAPVYGQLVRCPVRILQVPGLRVSVIVRRRDRSGQVTLPAPSRIRGSRSGYIMSTIKLASMNSVVEMIANAMITG